jgi:hypothetical protein
MSCQYIASYCCLGTRGGKTEGLLLSCSVFCHRHCVVCIRGQLTFDTCQWYSACSVITRAAERFSISYANWLVVYSGPHYDLYLLMETCFYTVNIWQIHGEIIFNPVLYVICSKEFTNFPKFQEFSDSARCLKGEIEQVSYSGPIRVRRYPAEYSHPGFVQPWFLLVLLVL